MKTIKPTLKQKPLPFGLANPNAIAAAPNGVRMSNVNRRYDRFYVQGYRPAADAVTVNVINTGTVYICTANDLTTCILIVPVGGGGELPPDGNLRDLWMLVANATDGLIGRRKPFVS